MKSLINNINKFTSKIKKISILGLLHSVLGGVL